MLETIVEIYDGTTQLIRLLVVSLVVGLIIGCRIPIKTEGITVKSFLTRLSKMVLFAILFTVVIFLITTGVLYLK